MPTLATAVGIGSAAVAMDVIVVDYTSFFSPSNGSNTEREREREKKKITLISVDSCTTCLQMHCCSYCSNIYKLAVFEFLGTREKQVTR